MEENAVYVRYQSNSPGRGKAFCGQRALPAYTRQLQRPDEHRGRALRKAPRHHRGAGGIGRAEGPKYDGSPAFTGYEITSFEQTDVFEGDSVQYEVYAWNVAFTTGGSTEGTPFAGGMALDAEGRVIGF